MSDTTAASAIGVSGSLLGVLIGWFLNRWTVKRTVKEQEFYKAAAAFRIAFADEYRTLKAVVRAEDVDDTFVQNMLANAEVKHGKAYVVFRPYLSNKKGRQLDAAWADYLSPEGDAAEFFSPKSLSIIIGNHTMRFLYG
jgi:hypothetical protein